MLGPSSGVMFELRRVISAQKWANAPLALELYRSWMVYHHIIMKIFWRNGQYPSSVSARERTCGNKRKKQTLLQLT